NRPRTQSELLARDERAAPRRPCTNRDAAHSDARSNSSLDGNLRVRRGECFCAGKRGRRAHFALVGSSATAPAKSAAGDDERRSLRRLPAGPLSLAERLGGG